MNGWDGKAREAFTELSDALEKCRSALYDTYSQLHGRRLESEGQGILEKIDSVSRAIRDLGSVNMNMEDAGIE